MSPNSSEISFPVSYDPPAAPWSFPNGSQVIPIHPHLAGQSTIDMVKKKKLYYDNNYLATKNLIEVVKKFKTPNLIFSSTAAVYKKRNFKIEEISKLHSSNSYGNSKIKCENIIRKLNTKTTKFCILRFFNVSSSYVEDKVGEYHNPETHLIPIIIHSI